MKYIFTFLFGAACGVGGTLLWLRKDIKKRLAEEAQKASTSAEVPFTFGDTTTPSEGQKSIRSDSEASQGHSEREDAVLQQRKQDKIDYHRIVASVKAGEKPSVWVPVMPREETVVSSETVEEDDISLEKEDRLDDIISMRELPDEILPIDHDEWEYDKSTEKDRLVYYMGDRIMATENGTIIETPALLVGNNWESYVGQYLNNTALVRNQKLMTDYEIFVERGFYSDEYGSYTDD